jgi:hypothetical protein
MTVLSIRETEPLLLLASYRYLSRAQIEQFIFEGSSVAPGSRQVMTRRILQRLTARGLITAVPRASSELGGGSARLAYLLTPAGQRLVGLLDRGLAASRRPPRTTVLLSHSFLTADISLAFRRASRSHDGHQVMQWECDWQAAERVGSSLVVPDAHLVYGTPAYEIEAFIEVDMATEGTRFFAGKIGRYLELYRSGSWRTHLATWPVVLTVTPTAGRATALRQISEAVLSWQRDAEAIGTATEFSFSALADVLGSSGPLGAIWEVAGRKGLRPLLPEEEGGLSRRASADAAGRAQGSVARER